MKRTRRASKCEASARFAAATCRKNPRTKNGWGGGGLVGVVGVGWGGGGWLGWWGLVGVVGVGWWGVVARFPANGGGSAFETAHKQKQSNAQKSATFSPLLLRICHVSSGFVHICRITGLACVPSQARSACWTCATGAALIRVLGMIHGFGV